MYEISMGQMGHTFKINNLSNGTAMGRQWDGNGTAMGRFFAPSGPMAFRGLAQLLTTGSAVSRVV